MGQRLGRLLWEQDIFAGSSPAIRTIIIALGTGTNWLASGAKTGSLLWRPAHLEGMTTATLDATETTMLILVDPVKNSNKFYEVRLDAQGMVHIRYGRVGENGATTAPKPGGRAAYERAIAAKTRKGYVETAIAGTTKASTMRADASTKKQAQADLAGDSKDPRLTALIDRIVKVNAHEISVLSGGKMTVRDGQVATPLGLLTLPAIEEANVLLKDLVKKPTDANLLARYLTLVPQDVGRKRDWTESFFSGSRTASQQQTFLDQLRQSVEFAQAADEADAKGAKAEAKRAFAYSLSPVDDAKVIADIKKMFDASRNDRHVSARMRIVNVYATTSPASEAVFDEVAGRIGNVRRMWHGTRAYNLLSIFATGMQVPSRGGTIHIAGRMFGDGIYFSEQSTKSLNYSRGGMWSSGVDNRCMMFVADVAMGTEFHPNRHSGGTYNKVLDGKVMHPTKGKPFDSINVKAGTSGVMNHEAIVPGPTHVALRYLVEFEG